MLVCLEVQSYLVWVFLCYYRSSNRQFHYKYLNYNYSTTKRSTGQGREPKDDWNVGLLGNYRVIWFLGFLMCLVDFPVDGFSTEIETVLTTTEIDWNYLTSPFPAKIKQEDCTLLWCIYCLEVRIYVNLCYFWSSVFLSSFRQQVPTNYKYLN